MHKRKKGFTLIELLVVIAIIGIISAIILASINNSRQNTRDGQRLSDIKQLQNALELYAVSNGYTYPVDIYAASNPLGPYISKIPTDPSNNLNYRYVGLSPTGLITECTGYHLGVSLEKNNLALTNGSDSDFNSKNGQMVNPPNASPVFTDAYRCSATANNNLAINGADTGKCNTNDAGSYCYDIKR